MDKAQKWRGVKNLTRFLRNPLGFALWRYQYAIKLGQNVPYSFFNIEFFMDSS
jgi:hypothetical protein